MAEEKKQLDILKHKLVPQHTVISEKEKRELFEKFSINPDQLPKILDKDPVSLVIGAKPGQIVKIRRKSRTADEAVAYRMVVESNK